MGMDNCTTGRARDDARIAKIIAAWGADPLGEVARRGAKLGLRLGKPDGSLR
jgi:hypothetical protein